MASQDQHAQRWAQRMAGTTDKDLYARGTSNIFAEGDIIYSYGHHFEIARAVRDPKGQVFFLVNGDVFSNTTTRHQSTVRGAIQGTNLPSVIIPFSVLDEAGIDKSTVRIVEVTKDRVESWWEVSTTMPQGATWSYTKATLPGTGGWLNQETGEFVAAGWDDVSRRHIYEAPGRPVRDWGKESNDEHAVRFEAWRQLWQEVPIVQKNTGRKTLLNTWGAPYELFDDEGTVKFRIQRSRHWLGESLITGEVLHNARIRCPDCVGTGVGEPWIEHYPGEAEGPLTRRQDRWHHEYLYDPEWEDDGRAIQPRTVAPTRITTVCQRCAGDRWLNTRRTRRALFLSGFDRNEARASYFFTEMPPASRAKTIEDALEDLKPSAVKLAERFGREVKRQGDIFAIPMPGLTLRDLRKEDGQLAKSGRLFNTNHAATETFVTKDGRTYIRGILRHVPSGRRPDHARLPVGKTWHLAVKNLTPIGV